MEIDQPQSMEQSNTEMDEEQIRWYLKWQNWLKISILLMLVVFITLAIVFNSTTTKILGDFLSWMQNNAALGSFVFMFVYWICTVMFVPGLLLTVGAGFIFRQIAGPWGGVFLATLVVVIGASGGAATAFLLGRFVFREKVASYKAKYEKFDIIDKVVEQQGLKVTLLLRLAPVIPFNALNYFMGITGVSFRNYNIASIGIVPGTFAYCFIGGTLGAIGESVNAFDPVILGVTIGGTILAVIGMVYVSYVAKREFAKIAAQQKQKEMDDDPEKGVVGKTDDTADETGDSNPTYSEENPSASTNDNEEQSLTLGN